MNRIERDAYVLRDVIKIPVDYVCGTNALPIVIHFMDYDIPSGATAQVYVQKPSGNAVYNSCEISGNDVTVDVTTQMMAEVGESNMQIQISYGSANLVTFDQPVCVHKNRTDPDAEESENESSFFEELQSAANNANTAAQAANAAADVAESALSSIESAVQGTIINDNSPSAVTTYSGQKIENDFLKKNGDASNTTADYSSDTSLAPPDSGSTVGALIGWLVDRCGLIGNLATLATTAKTSIVAAINEVTLKIGNLTSLDTTEKTDLVSSVNEIYAHSAIEAGENYVKYADGRLEQWGRASVGSSGFVTVTFPETFVDTSYYPTATAEYAGSHVTFELSVQRQNASSMHIYFRDGSGALLTGVNAFWSAKGRWKGEDE